MENNTAVPQKKKKGELLHDLGIPLLDLYSEELKAGTWTDICILMYIAVLFPAAKR